SLNIVSAFIRTTPAMHTYLIIILLLCMMPYTLAFNLPIRGITEEVLHSPRPPSKANAHVRVKRRRKINIPVGVRAPLCDKFGCKKRTQAPSNSCGKGRIFDKRTRTCRKVRG
ncbi:hypothetical protein JTE90_012546, partial [Oedothorax gibbosus]